MPEVSHPIELDHLNQLLAAGNRWPHGPITGFRSERIGIGFGLSGTVHRLDADTRHGSRSLVVKLEGAELVTRALAFRSANETRLAGAIPVLLGWSLDGPDETGILLLEDVSPALQGDELRHCSPNRARSLVAVIARLHASTWDATRDSDGWGRRRWEPGRWRDRLARAADRYPHLFTLPALTRLEHLDVEADDAASVLASGPSAWIHGDPHLDNVLWRPSGDAVVVDWATASVGPPAFDVAVLLMSLAMGPNPSLTPEETLASYVESLEQNGIPLTLAEASALARLALVQLTQGMVGFVGFPTEPTEPRARLLRDDAATRVITALNWIDRDDPSHGPSG